MMENTCMNQLQFARNPQKRSIVMKTEMKVTLTRYILKPKCQAENACFIYTSMEKKDILKIPTEILAHFICKLFFILREQLRYDHPNIYIKKGKQGSLEALQSVDSTEYIN